MMVMFRRYFLFYILRFIPDKIYLSLMYFFHVHRILHFTDPQRYTEKIQWLKLYDKNPKYSLLVDKLKVKEYVSNLIGEEHVTPVLGVWNNPEEITFDSLPQQFVLKWNHNSGSSIICRNKNEFNYKLAVKQLGKGKWKNGYYYGREWPYKNIQPKVFAEQYISNTVSEEFVNYRFYIFDEKVKAICIDGNELCKKYLFYYYNDILFTSKMYIEISQISDILDVLIPIAIKLSVGLKYVRLDMYYSNGAAFFGEYTFYDASGFENIKPKKYDYILGSYLSLPAPYQQ